MVSTCELDKLVETPAPATLSVTPLELIDSAPLGSAAPRVTQIQVTSPSPGAPSWQASRARSSSWLTLSSSSGGIPASVDVSLVPVGLGLGSHQDTLILVANGGGAQPIRLPVRLTIHPCRPSVITPDTTIQGVIDQSDCGAPHREARFARVYRIDAAANDSISVRLWSSSFGPYLVLDSVPWGDALAESGSCPAGTGAACLRYARLPRTGGYTLAATSIDPGQSGAFTLEVTRPRPPGNPGTLVQLRRDTTTVVPHGATVPDTVMVLRAALADPDSGDVLWLDVELRPVGTSFTGTPTASSSAVSAGMVGTVRASGLADDAAYHWRARTRDETGRTGPWIEFTGNPETGPDFITAVPEAPALPVQLQQLKADAATVIAVGASTDERSVVLQASVADPDPGDALRLEVEVRPVGVEFTGTASASSPLVSSPAVASVAIGGLADDMAYHWQARAVDASGFATPWVSFGDNAETEPDVRVIVPATHLGFAVQPGNARPGGTMSTVEVEAREASGQRDLGFSGSVTVELAFGSGAPGAVLSGTVTVPAESGLARFGNLSIDLVGTGYRLTARASGLTPATSTPFDIVTGSPTRLTFAVEPRDITAGAVVNPAIRVSVLDEFGSVVTGYGGSVGLAIQPGSGKPGAALLGTATLNAVGGVATFSNISIDSAAAGFRLIATSAGVPTPDTSAAFQVAPGAATTLRVTGVADPVTAGVASNVTVTAYDAFGNVATGYLGTVRFTSSDPQATLPPSYAFALDDAGTRTFPGGVVLRTSGERSITAADLISSAISGSLAAITVRSAGAATLTVSGIADPVTAGVPSTVTVTARDAFGNVADGYRGTIGFASSDPGATLPAQYTYLAGDGGVRTFPTGVTLVKAGEHAVTATDQALGSITGSQGAITVQPAAPATLAFSTQPTAVTAGNLLNPAPQVTAFDAFGNVATGYAGTITVSLADGTGTAGAVLAGDLVEDAVNGVATFGTLSVNLAGVGYRLAATDTGLPAATSHPFDVAPGAANHLSFSTQPLTATAGATIATIRVSVLDGQNNLVPGATEPITLAIAPGTGTGGATLQSSSLSSPPTVTPINGVATFSDLFIERSGAGYRLRALASGVTAALSNLFNVTAASPATLTVFAGAGQTAPVGTAVPVDPAVRVADQFNNPVPDVSIAFTPSGTGAITGNPAISDPGGVATLGSWILGRRAAVASDTLTASVPSVAPVRLVASATVGPADTLRAVSSTSLAGMTVTQASPAPTVIVVDRFGNPVQGVSVTFTPSAGSVAPSAPVVTVANGQAAVQWTYGSATGPQTLTATVGGLVGSPVMFQANVSVPTVTLSLDRTSLLENGGDGPAVITATLSAVSGQAVTVSLGFTGTATALGDYDWSATQIVIPAGNVSGTVSLTALPDATDEADETLIVDITSVLNGTELGTQQVTVTILDDDAPPAVGFSSAAQAVGESAGTTATVTVQLSSPSGQPVTVPFTVGGTATGNGVDYSVSGSPVVIQPGFTAGTISVTVAPDLADEPDETVVVTLGTPTNATLGATTIHTVTITDNDESPSVTLGASTTVLSETGGSATLTATLSAVSGFEVTVALALGGTATGNGTDYTVSGVPIVIPAGSLTGAATISAVGDLLDEANESIIVDVDGVTNGTESGVQQLTLTITDDDAAPAVQFAAASQSNDEGVATVTATVQLSAPSGRQVTVPFTVGGTATSPGDYTTTASPVVITAGATSGTATITVVDDLLHETDETVVLTLGTPTNAVLAATTVHTATITDNDDPPTVQFAAAVQSNPENVATVLVTVQLSALSGQPVTVPFTVGGTATGNGTDYGLTASPLTIAAGATGASITLTIVSDTLDEADETVVLTLGLPVNAGLGGAAVHTATIEDDDAAPTVTLGAEPASIAENGGTATVTVTLSAVSGLPVTVDLGYSGSATLTSDYTRNGVQIVIAPGSASGSVTVSAVNDLIDEPDETVIVEIAAVTNGTEVTPQQVTITVVDDEGVPTVSFSVGSQSNTESVAAVTATVRLSEISGQDVTVPFTVTGTATGAGTDYTVTASPVTIPAGQNSVMITITVANDALDEDDETVVLTLGTPTNAGLGGTTVHTATITDDDATPTVQFTTGAQANAEGVVAVRAILELSAVSGREVTVPFTVGGTATGAGTDYTITASPAVIPAGSTRDTVLLTVVDDALDEADEIVVLTLGTPTNAGLGTTTAHTATITDDDATPTVQFTTVSQSNSEAVATVRAILELSAVSGREVTVPFTVGGTATSPADYTLAPAATAVIPAGSTRDTVVLTVVDDALDEADETVVLTLGTPTNAGLGTTTVHTATISDDDALPIVEFTAASQTGPENAGTITVTVELSGPSGREVTVPFTVDVAGTATGAGVDYSVTASPVVIAGGATSGTLTISVVNDALDEADETVVLSLGAPGNASLGAITTHTATIADDDDTPTLAVNDVTVIEGDGGATVNALFTVTLSAPSGRTVTVNYATADGTAQEPGDYTRIETTLLSFPPGVTAQTIAVVVHGDALDEGTSEQFTVNLSAASNAGIADGQGVGTITDDDEAPTLSINDVAVSEGPAGTPVNAQFTVTLSAPSGQTVTVSYATADGTAAAPGDYTAIASTLLTFAPGITGQAVTVLVQGDALDEADETFTVGLSGPTNATIADGVGVGTILDDDATPTVQFTTASQSNSEAVATVRAILELSAVSGREVTVPFTVGGTATSPADYTLAPSSPAVIPAGSTRDTVVLTVVDDALDEADETVVLTLGTPTNAGLGTTTVHTATISDDDAAPTVQFTAAAQSNAESAATVTATVQLSTVSGQEVTVPFTVGGTATGGGTDYTNTASPVVIPAGQGSKTITLTVADDALDEANETVVLTLGTPTNAGLGTTVAHTATIIDDDDPPAVEFTAPSQSGPESAGTITATVELSAPSGRDVTVPFTVGGTATSPADYTVSASPVVFVAGVTTGTITITVANDALDETDETVVLTLGTPTNATPGAATVHTATITDDDASPTLSVNDVAVVEGDAPSTVNAVFTVTLSAASGRTATVSYATADGTAVAPGDYTAIAPTLLTFAPGETAKSVTAVVQGDALDEVDETFTVSLSGAVNAVIAVGTGQGTINDDDTPPTLSIDDVGVTEGDAGTVNAVFSVNLSAASGQTVTVSYATADGTAAAPGDYTAIASTPLTFAPGLTSQAVTVLVQGDALDEADETFTVGLSGPTNATIADGVGVGTILDDDATPTVQFTTGAQANGEGVATVRAILELSAASGREVTVPFTVGGTATSPADYTLAPSSPAVIPAGSTRDTIVIAVVDDALDEADETVVLTLGTPTNAEPGLTTAHTATITDDDGAPSVTLGVDLAAIAEDGGVATVTATLSAVSGLPVTVDLGFTGTATLTSDYTRSGVQIGIPAGSTTGSVTVTGVDDGLDEPDETVVVEITAVTNGTEATPQQVTVTIQDDDAVPTVSFTVASQTNGEGVAPVTATVQLSAVSGQEVTVPFTVGGTATGGGTDYTITASPLVISAGASSGTVTITVADDTLDEPDETVVLTLGTPTNAGLGTTTVHTATITDDDATPTLSIDDVTVLEADAAPSVNAVFTVTLSAPSGQTVTVNYGTADATAAAPGDYTAITSTQLTFPPGVTSQPVTVVVLGDGLDETDETFTVNLSTPVNATIADGLGIGTIIDDDAPPAVTLGADSTVLAEGGTGPAVVTATLSVISGLDVTVVLDFSGTATLASDYTRSANQIVIPAGSTTGSITLNAVADVLDEADETVGVDIGSVTNGAETGTQQVTVTIADDDAEPTLSIDDVTVLEADATPIVNAVFTLTLSAASGRTVTVDYATANGTAAAPGDYTAIIPTQLTFAPGVTSQTVTVEVQGDALHEANETFTVNLTDPTNATIGDGQGLGTITNDDAAPSVTLTVDSTALAESGSGPALVTATLSASSGLAVSVDLGFTGTATSVTDFTSSGTQIVIPVGSTTGTITLHAAPDDLDEPDETVVVDIIAVSNGSEVGQQQVTVTITDDDAPPSISFATATSTVAEGAGTVAVTVTLSAVSGQDITVEFSIDALSTAESPADYGIVSSSPLTVSAGVLSATITLSIVDDTDLEGLETVILNLANPSKASLGVLVSHAVTITDNDP